MEELDLEEIAILALADLLKAEDAPAGLVTLFGDRMFPVVAPDNTAAPYLVFSQADEDVTQTKDGDVSNGWSFLIDLYAPEYQQIKRGARYVRKALNGKETDVEGIGTLKITITDEGQEVYDETRELLTLALEFRGTKIK